MSKRFFKNIIGKLIQFIEKIEYKDLVLDENDFSKKFLSFKALKGEILTDVGFQKVKGIYKTQPYRVYQIKLKNGYTLECADNHLVFKENYSKIYVKDLKLGYCIITDKGPQQVVSIKKLPYKVSMYDLSLNDGSLHRYYTNGILSHNTTTVSAYFLWSMVFHPNKQIAIVANKAKTSTEIVGKIKNMLERLPFFLKPGMTRLAQTTLTFENGSYLMSASTNPTSVTGQSINLLYLDEAAHIPNNLATDFWRSVFPTISSFKNAQIIITSTPKGKQNLFFRLYDGACKHTNDFVPYRVDWWEVPGRDEEWAEKERRSFGEENFDQEYGLQFDTVSSRLIRAKDLKLMSRIKKTFISYEFDGLEKVLSNKLIWHPDFDPTSLTSEDLMNRRFLFVIDTAEGKEIGVKGKKDSDWNVINIFEVEAMSPIMIMKNKELSGNLSLKDCVQYRQIGLYLDNDRDEEVSAHVLKFLVYNLFKSGQGMIDNSRVLLEMNFNGKNFLNIFMDHPLFYSDLVLKTYHVLPVPGQVQKKKYGFKTTGGAHGKSYYCELGAKMISRRQIIISQFDEDPNKSSIGELEAFGKNDKGVYEGSCVHDDISVTILFVSRVQDIQEFQQWIEDYFDSIQSSNYKIKKIKELFNKYVDENEEYSDSEFNDLYMGNPNGLGFQSQNLLGMQSSSSQFDYQRQQTLNSFLKNNR